MSGEQERVDHTPFSFLPQCFRNHWSSHLMFVCSTSPLISSNWRLGNSDRCPKQACFKTPFFVIVLYCTTKHTQLKQTSTQGKWGIEPLPYFIVERQRGATATPRCRFPLCPHTPTHYLLGVNVDLESNFKGFPPDVVLVFINKATLGNIVHGEHLKTNTAAT